MTISEQLNRPPPLRYPALVWQRPGRLPRRFDGRRLGVLLLSLTLLFGAAVFGWISLPRAVRAWINASQYRALVAQRELLGRRYNVQVQALTALQARIGEGLQSVTHLRQVLTLPSPSGVRGAPVESMIPARSIYADLAETRVQVERTVRVSLAQWQAELAAVEGALGGVQERLAQTPTVVPLAADRMVLSADFGRHRDVLTETTRFHNGMLIAASLGAEIIAPADGRVAFTGVFRSSRDSWQRLGRLVVLRHGDDFITILGHCDRARVSPGEEVRRGQVVGEVGDSGLAPHSGVYYEVRMHLADDDPEKSGLDWVPVDPKFFILDHAWGDDAPRRAAAGPQRAPEFELLPYALRR